MLLTFSQALDGKEVLINPEDITKITDEGDFRRVTLRNDRYDDLVDVTTTIAEIQTKFREYMQYVQRVGRA